MITTSDTIVLLKTWEHENGLPHLDIVPLPHAEKMVYNGGFFKAQIILESGEIFLEK